MSATVDLLKPKRVLLVASNPAVSTQTGWPIGFWWSELTHPYWEFAERGIAVDVASPDGGALVADTWSDPRDASGYSATDILSLGFVNTPALMEMVTQSKRLGDINASDYDAVLLVGGQAPMFTFYNDERVHRFVANFYETGKPTAVICHATCVLLKVRLSNGSLLVQNKTWTGFANSEEQSADDFVGKKIQPFWIEDEARKMTDTNFITQGRFRSFAVRDGNLITGQQQYSGAEAARRVIEAIGL